MANVHETLVSLFEDTAAAIRDTSSITEDIFADSFPAYIRAKDRSDCPATPSDYFSCPDSFIEWVTENGLAEMFWINGIGSLKFLKNAASVGTEIANIRIPGVAYSPLASRYFTIGSHATIKQDLVYAYMLNESLQHEGDRTGSWSDGTVVGNNPSCIGYQSGWVWVGFNGNTGDNGTERAIARWNVPAAAATGSLSGWATSSNGIRYQVNGVAASSHGNLFFYGEYNNTERSGSVSYTTIASAEDEKTTLASAGLGNLSGQSPIIAAVSYAGYPIGFTKGTTILMPVDPSDTDGSSSYDNDCVINSAEEGVGMYAVNDQLVVCTKVSEGSYKLYYATSSTPTALAASNFASVAISKPPKAILYHGGFYLFVYEDGTVEAKANLTDSGSIYSRKVVSYDNVSVRDVVAINDKIIITAWYGDGLVNSAVAYYDV